MAYALQSICLNSAREDHASKELGGLGSVLVGLTNLGYRIPAVLGRKAYKKGYCIAYISKPYVHRPARTFLSALVHGPWKIPWTRENSTTCTGTAVDILYT